MKYIRPMMMLLVLSLLIAGCSSVTISTGGNSGSGGNSGYGTGGTTPGTTNTGTTTGTQQNLGTQSKTSGCQVHNALPDSACTPGAIFATATKSAICTSGYARTVRNVPTSEKQQAYSEYGVYSHTTGQYEVDHLVSLELGGSNDIANLWPEAASPQPGFHEKDKVENYLHDQVCSGAIPLKQAQIEIATNWLSVYNSMTNK